MSKNIFVVLLLHAFGFVNQCYALKVCYRFPAGVLGGLNVRMPMEPSDQPKDMSQLDVSSESFSPTMANPEPVPSEGDGAPTHQEPGLNDTRAADGPAEQPHSHNDQSSQEDPSPETHNHQPEAQPPAFGDNDPPPADGDAQNGQQPSDVPPLSNGGSVSSPPGGNSADNNAYLAEVGLAPGDLPNCGEGSKHQDQGHRLNTEKLNAIADFVKLPSLRDIVIFL